MQYGQYLIEARRLAREAGKLLLSKSSKLHSMEFKGHNNPVTVMDRQSEQIITEGLRKAFPDHGIVGEEGTSIESKEGYCWIIDPLDGTTNYAHALPFYCVSIGLVYKNEPIVGVVYAPQFEAEFYASKDGGAFLNGEKISVSKTPQLEKAFLATGEAYSIVDRLDYHMNLFKKMIRKSFGIRRFGSAALDLCHVACGRYDGYWEADLKPWDAAAGILILGEAGGKVSDYDGKPYVLGKSESILATNGLIHAEMVKTLSS